MDPCSWQSWGRSTQRFRAGQNLQLSAGDLRKAQRLLWDPGMEQFPGMGIRKFLPTKPSTDIPPDRTKIKI